MIDFEKLNREIPAFSEKTHAAAVEKWNSVAHPLHSLGRLEDMIALIAGIKGSVTPSIARRLLPVMCADNGVLAQGVSQTDESITSLVAFDLTRGTSSANVMADVAHVDIRVVDTGMKNPPDCEGIMNYSVARGTRDFTTSPAMTDEECIRAVEAGLGVAHFASENGYDMLATGEMGIGNTTTCAAVASVLLGVTPGRITGRGAGLSDEGLKRKISAVKRGIALNAPDRNRPLEVLAKVGGFDIAAMTGLFIGGALHRIPVVIDGVISSVAAVAASRLCPACKHAMLPSHMSKEPAARLLMKELGFTPVIDAQLHLGEGTGALCLFPLLDMAMAMYNGKAFEEIGMDAYTPQH